MARNNWHLVVCGVSHKTSSLQEREPLQIGSAEIAGANAAFRALPGVLESAIVATCNRLEFYFVAKKNYEPWQVVRSFYGQRKGVDLSDLRTRFYTRRDRHAVYHLFQVAAGLDSMVLGENQILGQVKDAYSSACAVKAAGKVIHRLFHQAFRVGKQVRTDTEMGKGACSVSSAAVGLLRQQLDQQGAPTVLFVGVNQMIALAVSNLSKWDGARFLFANRTPEKAVEFASRYGATGHALDELPSLLARADVVISCTSSERPIISSRMLASVVAGERDRKLVIIDMAIPRDVDVGKEEFPAVTVYDLEDVRSFAKQQQEQRELAVPESEAIIERKLDEFMYWYDHVRHESVYNELEESYEEIRAAEMEPVLQMLAPDARREIDSATRRLVDRLLSVGLQAISSTEDAK